MQTALREGSALRPAAEANRVRGQPPQSLGRQSGQDPDRRRGQADDLAVALLQARPAGCDRGFVTRGRGISIHRVDCADFQDLARKHPERVIPAGVGREGARHPQRALPGRHQRPGERPPELLRDISEVLSREAQRHRGQHAHQKAPPHALHHEVGGIKSRCSAITLVREVPGDRRLSASERRPDPLRRACAASGYGPASASAARRLLIADSRSTPSYRRLSCSAASSFSRMSCRAADAAQVLRRYLPSAMSQAPAVVPEARAQAFLHDAALDFRSRIGKAISMRRKKVAPSSRRWTGRPMCLAPSAWK